MTANDPPAKRVIIREWDNWSAKNPDQAATKNAAAKFFFDFLQREHSELLTFPTSKKKWNVVYEWLLSEGRVKE